jgi:WD40 repeat protein
MRTWSDGGVQSDGAYLVSASSDHTAGSGASRLCGSSAHHSEQVNTVAFSPDGAQVATASSDVWLSQDNTVQLWEVGIGRETAVYNMGGADIRCVQSRYRYPATASGTVPPEVGSDHWPSRGPHDPRGSGLGRGFQSGWRLFSHGEDGTARVWEAHTGVPSPASHGRNVAAAVFSP